MLQSCVNLRGDFKQSVDGNEVEYLSFGRLGGGSFGNAVLYSARRLVVLKEVATPTSEILKTEPNVLKLARSEPKLLTTLCHPNIVRICQAWQNDGKLVMELEYCGGESLRKEITKHLLNLSPFELGQVKKWLTQMCLGTAYLHDLGIVHRNLNPDNVLLTTDLLTVKITGFITAKSYDATNSKLNPVIGTVPYLAPEAFGADDSLKIQPKVDCWALGVIAFELAALELPYKPSHPSTAVEDITRQLTNKDSKPERMEIVSKRCVQLSCLIEQKLLVVLPEMRSDLEQVLSDPFITDESTKQDRLLHNKFRQVQFKTVQRDRCDKASQKDDEIQNASSANIKTAELKAENRPRIDISALRIANSALQAQQSRYEKAVKEYDKQIASLMEKLKESEERLATMMEQVSNSKKTEDVTATSTPTQNQIPDTVRPNQINSASSPDSMNSGSSMSALNQKIIETSKTEAIQRTKPQRPASALVTGNKSIKHEASSKVQSKQPPIKPPHTIQRPIRSALAKPERDGKVPENKDRPRPLGSSGRIMNKQQHLLTMSTPCGKTLFESPRPKTAVARPSSSAANHQQALFIMPGLFDAARQGNVAKVTELIDCGADVNARDSSHIRDSKFKWTPLHYAAAEGNVGVVVVLLDKGGSIDDPKNDGFTPLMAAAQHGELNVVKLLMEHKANLNAEDYDGFTALIHAVKYGHENVVEFLLKNGSSINHRNKLGKTALYYASGSIAKLLKSKNGRQ